MRTILPIAMLAALAIFVAVPRAFWEASAPPADAAALAQWLMKHPTDYAAASVLTEQALDLDLPRRVALWHAAFALGAEVAPYRSNAPAAFTRAGLGHWYELSAADRAEVLRRIEPLLREPQFFETTWQPLWEVTGDVSLLRRANPGTENALTEVARLAAMTGHFDDYRAMRDALARRRLADFEAKRGSATPAELVNALPAPPYRTDDEPLIRALLNELHVRPLDEPANATIVAGVIDYALRHHLAPLDGLESATRDASVPVDATAPTRTWQGLCDRDVCTRATNEIRGPAHLTLERVQSDEVPPYVEVYVDDRRVAEMPLPERATVEIPGGDHRVEIDLVNPRTRNQLQRRLRIV